MLNVQVTITGDKETIFKLKKLGNELSNWRPELEQVADYLENFYKGPVFETQGAIFGERWVALNPFYELWKRKNYPGRGILEATGKMRKNWQRKVNDSRMVLANMTPYAKYHQQPDGPGKGIMPKRVIIKFDDKNKKYVVNIFKNAIINKIANAAKN